MLWPPKSSSTTGAGASDVLAVDTETQLGRWVVDQLWCASFVGIPG